MSFINPLDLFGISPQDPAPDSTTLRKARRAKLLEFDLADEGLIYYKEVPITRADFLRACEEIEEPGKLAAYRGLQRLPSLQGFLLHGSLAFFDEDSPRWAYHPQFLEVIGPYYAERFASTLADAVREGDRSTTRRLTSRPPVAPECLYPRIYGDAERVVTDQAQRLEDLRSRIERGQALDTSPAQAASGVMDVRLLEELPPYFEGARSKVGQAARLLAVTAFNELDDVDAAAAVLRSISDLSVNAITADRIRQDLEQIESIRERRQLSERHAPTLEAAASALVRFRTLMETAEAGPFDAASLVDEVEGIVDIDDLNKLPEELAELRDHVALSLRALALACWNKHYEADIAVALTKIAIRLRTSNDVSEALWDDIETLQEMGSEASTKAAEEGQLLLNLLRKVDSDTNVGFFGPNVNWVAVERFLDDLFDEGGIRLLRALKDEPLKTRIRSTLYSILDRLGRHRASGASRIRARVQPALAASTSARSTPASTRSSRPPATSAKQPASSRSGGRSSSSTTSAAPTSTTRPTKSDDEGSLLPVVVGIFLFFAFVLLIVAANEGSSRAPATPRPTPAPVTIGPSMQVTVVAANGKLSPVRIKVDGDVRRPYWVELGDEVTFTVTDSAFVEQELDDLTISVNGEPFPTDYRDGRGRVAITRESVRAVLSGTNLPAPPPQHNVVDDGLRLAELTGHWSGELTRPGEVWSVELKIRPSNDGSISGSILKSLGDNTVMWSIGGTYHGGELQFDEVQVLDERRASGATAPWCSRTGILQTRRSGSDLILEGSMQDDSGSCPSGRLRVVRSSGEVAEGVRVDPSRWNGNQLATGDSPYNAYFGSGVYSSYDENEITFRNGPSSDVVICLVDLYSNRVIRNEYIRAGDTFTMTDVPDGTYFIRGVYGRDWNPNLKVLGGRVMGGFQTNASYSQSRQDPLQLVDDGYSATAYEVTLYTVSNGNMESSGINASSFFD